MKVRMFLIITLLVYQLVIRNIKNNIRKILILVIIVTLILLIFISFRLLSNYSSEKKNTNIITEETIEITFKDMVYDLPKGWLIRNYEESGVKKLNI